MSSSRHRRPGCNRELLLLLGALGLFVVGSGWIALRAREERPQPRSWVGALPTVGLPLLHSLRIH